MRNARAGGCWLGFLADQLDRPTTPSITPTLCFGVAVDGGSCAFKNPFTRFRSISKKCHCGQVGALKEGAQADAGNAVRDRNTRQASAEPEGLLPDADDIVTNRDACQAVAKNEGKIPYAGNAIRDRDATQDFASTEGTPPYAGNTIRNRDARQVAAAIEGSLTDTGDSFRDLVIGICFACRISMQRSLLLPVIEQNSIDTRVILVPRANLKRRQAGATTEGSNIDAGDAITNRDARQAGAVVESTLADTGDAVRDRDARQVAAAPEGPKPKAVDPDAGDGFTLNDRRYG